MEDETTQRAIAELHFLENLVPEVLRAVNAKKLPAASSADALSLLQQAHSNLRIVSRLFERVSAAGLRMCMASRLLHLHV